MLLSIIEVWGFCSWRYTVRPQKLMLRFCGFFVPEGHLPPRYIAGQSSPQSTAQGRRSRPGGHEGVSHTPN